MATASPAADAGEVASQAPTSSQRPAAGGERLRQPGAIDAKRPTILRRYGAAIAIAVLFVAAGGAAAGIAALRGPVAPPPTHAQDQAAANGAVLQRADFPAGWHESSAFSPAAYGVGSVLVTPSIVQFWIAAHPVCATALGTLSSAMMPSGGGPTAFAFTSASAASSLGGSWQIADAAAFRATAAQAGRRVSGVRSCCGQPREAASASSGTQR